METNQAQECIWTLSAETTLQAMVDSGACLPLLRDTLTGVMSWQERNRRPLQRALISPSIAPQWSAALLALGAWVTVTDEGDSGTWSQSEMALEELLQKRVEGEVVSVHVRTDLAKWGMAQVGRTPTDEPIVAAVAAVELQDAVVQQARIALTGVWSTPVQLAAAANQLVGGPLDAARIEAVARAVEQEVAPREDFRGSAEYRRAMAGVMTRRALEQCMQQERER
jgi:CO/xanthine dehydrogenase FAD-binding subunit